MKIYVNKTVKVTNGIGRKNKILKIENEEIVRVKKFTYLESKLLRRSSIPRWRKRIPELKCLLNSYHRKVP